MTIVDTEPFETFSEGGDIVRHVLPQPRVRGRSVSVTQFDTVTPYDDLATEVRFGRGHSEVDEGVRVPDPTIVGERVFLGIGTGFSANASEIRFYKGQTIRAG